MLFGGTVETWAEMTGGLPLFRRKSAMIVLVAAKSSTSSGRILQFGSTTGVADKVIGLDESGAFEYNNGNLSLFQLGSCSFGSIDENLIYPKDRGEFYRDGEKITMRATNGSVCPSLNQLIQT